jgi:hypothetical protein
MEHMSEDKDRGVRDGLRIEEVVLYEVSIRRLTVLYWTDP